MLVVEIVETVVVQMVGVLVVVDLVQVLELVVEVAHPFIGGVIGVVEL
jgi:hypothetical protein